MAIVSEMATPARMPATLVTITSRSPAPIPRFWQAATLYHKP